MSTTTIRLDAALKARVAAAALRAGKTSHAFILEALAETIDQIDYEDELHRLADERWAKLLSTAQTVSWNAAKSYVRALGRGGRPRKPSARKLGR